VIQEDAGKGDCAGCDCAFFFSIAAEISVTANDEPEFSQAGVGG
jgi:hypothetical protein